ncbi:MAG: hypothetical protein D6766_12490 [Verrucomicrobia bacterium]|nr:MAG: hypothetical protein D6766_12490 [Verrucomicrobiota bacterium]
MWICSKLGFFSVVRKTDGWHVRARVREDLAALAGAAGVEARIQRWPLADYRWRLILGPEDLHRIFAALEASVDYPNFKEAIGRDPGQREKLGAYHELWTALARLQSERDRGAEK